MATFRLRRFIFLSAVSVLLLVLLNVFYLNLTVNDDRGDARGPMVLRGRRSGTFFRQLDDEPSAHPGSWSLRDTSFVGTSSFNLADTRNSLRGKHILFVGDSITRYMFLSLVTVLHTGHWPQPTCGDSNQPNPLYEGDYGTWYDLFKAFEDVAGDSVRCQCYRDRADKRAFYENRFYYNREYVRVCGLISFVPVSLRRRFWNSVPV
jgi:hypothetical protein